MSPDFSHTDTCYHVHTKIVPTPTKDQVATDNTTESTQKKSKKCPLGMKRLLSSIA
ncbi:hypothetical protein E2542_SST26382 [Spatholobus suberectus]|nr:hypothetical protein E2542_SST26382 [Spatholobus suberectus]